MPATWVALQVARHGPHRAPVGCQRASVDLLVLQRGTKISKDLERSQKISKDLKRSKMVRYSESPWKISLLVFCVSKRWIAELQRSPLASLRTCWAALLAWFKAALLSSSTDWFNFASCRFYIQEFGCPQQSGLEQNCHDEWSKWMYQA